MPYSSSIYSILLTDPSPIPEGYYTLHHRKQHQAHSLISQDPHIIAFSTASPTILPMTDHSQHGIDIRDLDSRLALVERQQRQQGTSSINTTTTTTNNSNNNNKNSIHGVDESYAQRRARSSLDSTIMPPFTKSSTMSTTDSSATHHSNRSAATGRLHAQPSCHVHAETVGLGAGTFSKPRVARRSRRDTSRSSSSSSSSSGGRKDEPATAPQQQFKYYGRHGNQWLFNDFSVTDAVAKGFKRVFSGREAGSGDWYEDRGS